MEAAINNTIMLYGKCWNLMLNCKHLNLNKGPLGYNDIAGKPNKSAMALQISGNKGNEK